VAHRAERREQQKKEIERLTATLKNLKKHGEYMLNQIAEFEKYLQGCRVNAVKKAKEKKKKPLKFTYKELVKKEVILSSDVPELSYVLLSTERYSPPLFLSLSRTVFLPFHFDFFLMLFCFIRFKQSQQNKVLCIDA
jgi:hypothetical protein